MSEDLMPEELLDIDITTTYMYTLQFFFFLFFFIESYQYQNAKFILETVCEKVQVGKDQEKAQSEKDSHSKNRGGKKPN